MKLNRYFRACACALFALAAMTGTACSNAPKEKTAETTTPTEEPLPKVYMFKEISSENLVKIYKALGREATGKVAVKSPRANRADTTSCNPPSSRTW